MKIALLGCKGTSLDLLKNWNQLSQYDINLVITLSKKQALYNKVAFYQGEEVIDYCSNMKIPLYLVNAYDLLDKEDSGFIEKEQIDLLIVLGWERLVPLNILNSLKKYAVGMHGSPYGLPKGRGRSPLNWSVITNENKFITYLFKYTPNIDDGDIIGYKVFDINSFDTISSLHTKNRIAMQQLLNIYLPLIKENGITFMPQPPEEPTFYPKRISEDSGIDWSLPTNSIYNLIRAVQPPYPPAFCFLRDKKINIVEAYPFDSTLFHNQNLPGTIEDISYSLNQYIVKTIDGSLIIKNYYGVSINDLVIGEVLSGVNESEKMVSIRKRYSNHIFNREI